MKRLSFTVILLFAIAPAVSAIPLGENMFIALPEESVTCIDIFLPDSMGLYSPGLRDFLIESNAAPWGDITEQIVTTDENNTVKVPLCFSSFGRTDGDCSDTYTLSLQVPATGTSKDFQGGVCVSQFPDVDTGVPLDGNPQELLNKHIDLFDLSFSNPVQIIGDGETAEFTLLVQSHADIVLDLHATGLIPTTQTISLGHDDPTESLAFQGTQERPVSVTATIRDCPISCTKITSGEIKIGEDDRTGYAISLFPENLNVKVLEPVTYQLVINNFEEEKEFHVDLVLPLGVQSGFQSQTVSVSGEHLLSFEVVPESPSSLYFITMIVSAGEQSKTTSASLSTNELLTDALREGDVVKQSNPEAADQVDDAIDSWYQSYKDAPYGSELEEYAALQEELNGLQGEPPTQEPTPQPLPPPPVQQPVAPDYTLFIIIGVIAAVIVLLAVVALKRSGKKTVEVAELEA